MRGRTRKLRRRREGNTAAIVVVLALFSLVDLLGRSASEGFSTSTPSDEGLFGASSLFGPSIGGYVLVALVAAVVAVLVTVFFTMRRPGKGGEEEADTETSGDSAGENEGRS
ncbi:MAG: hypothetical protein Q4A93_04635 [Actinomycetota bacterium]|nr:hypothetical protein [Actinomycetota bacterium]